MTTNELIKLLKEQDPIGDSQVLINSLTPKQVIIDNGITHYIENEKLIFTKNRNILNIISLNIDNFIYKYFNDVYKHIIFDNLDDDEINNIKQKINSLVIEAKTIDKEKTKEFTNIILNKINQGYKIIQDDTHDLYFIKSDEKIKLSPEDCRTIIRGSFKPIKYNDKIEWEYYK